MNASILRRNGDKLLSDAADLFSRDAWDVEFRNAPMIAFISVSQDDAQG